MSLLLRRAAMSEIKNDVLVPLTVLISSDYAPIDTGITVNDNVVLTIRGNRDTGATAGGDMFSDGTTFLGKRNTNYSNAKAFNEDCNPYIKASTTKNYIINGVDHSVQWATNTSSYFVASAFVQATNTMKLAVHRSYSSAGYRFYYVKATIDGVLAHDLRPYLKNGKPGFLDIITNEFHTVAEGSTDWTYE